MVCSMQVSTPAVPARRRAGNKTRLHAFAESCTKYLSRAKRPSRQWCVSPGCKFGPDRNRRLDTGGAAQSATPYGRLKLSPRSRPSCPRKVASDGCCSMGACVGRQRRAGAGGFETRPYIGCPVPAAQAPNPFSAALPAVVSFAAALDADLAHAADFEAVGRPDQRGGAVLLDDRRAIRYESRLQHVAVIDRRNDGSPGIAKIDLAHL